jgi:hypothetical protein
VTRRILAAIAILGLGALAYVAAVEISFRMLGNCDELSPAHRQLLDEERW